MTEAVQIRETARRPFRHVFRQAGENGHGGSPRIDAAAHKGAATDDPMLRHWTPATGSADADLLPDLDTLVARSRDMARNNGLAAGAIQTLTDNVVGHVLRLSANPNWRALGRDKEWADQWQSTVEPLFQTWAETPQCDASRTLNFLGLTLLALRSALLNGDALALPVWLERPGEAWRTKLMLIEADRLSTPHGRENDTNIRGGVEIDRHGAPVAYWIRKTHPGDVYLAWQASIDEWERIPAFTPWGRRMVIHLHDKERTGQSRAKPIFSAVMRAFRQANAYQNAELDAAVNNALIAGFLESNLDPTAILDLFGGAGGGGFDQYWNEQVGGTPVRLKSGAFLPLPIGAKVASYNPDRPNTAFEAFQEAVLRHIAAGIHIPYELLAKDFSKTNYSSARAALLEAWRYFLGRRRWLMDYWLTPIYELWLEEAVNAGRIDAPDYYANRQSYARARWIFAGRGWVDPVKEAQAAQIRIETGLSTLEAECAEQGLDWEEVLHQQARERALREELGMSGPDTASVMQVQAPTDQPQENPTQ